MSDFNMKFKVKKIIHQSDNNHVIAEVLPLEVEQLSEQKFPVVVTITLYGQFFRLEIDDIFSTSGKVFLDNDYQQYKFKADQQCIEVVPVKKEEVIKYIFRKVNKKMTMKRIESIMSQCGAQASFLKRLYQNPKLLDKVNELSPKERQRLITVANENYALDELIMFFDTLHIPSSKAIKFYERWDVGAIGKIQKNPYLLVMYEMLTFNEAQSIVFSTCKNPEKLASRRSEALAYWLLLQELNGKGNTYIPKDELLEKVSNILKAQSLDLNEDLDVKTDDKIAATEAIEGLVKAKFAVVKQLGDTTIVKTSKVEKIEKEAACKLIEIQQTRAEHTFYERAAIEFLDGEMAFSKEQRDAIYNGMKHKVSILTGGPGTGKTHTLKGLVKGLTLMYPSVDIRCLAPTGKAAVRMQQATGILATTIHSALHSVVFINEDTGQCFKKKSSTGYIDGDYFIIDEMSMTDQEVFSSFLEHCNPSARYIFVGDEDQLPSVRYGAVLRELIKSDIFPCVRLSKIYRQDETSRIAINAHKFKSNDIAQIKTIEFANDSDFMIMEGAESRLKANLLALVKSLRSKKHYALEDILILSPMKVSGNGALSLNTFLQGELNAKFASTEVLVKGCKRFRVNDRVMQLVNNKEKGESGVFNGLIGKVETIEGKGDTLSMLVSFPEPVGDIWYTGIDECDQLDLAYVITTHKSQGSQAKVVILLTPQSQSKMLTMNLVYTGITRAEEIFICLGNKKAFYDSALRRDAGARLNDFASALHLQSAKSSHAYT